MKLEQNKKVSGKLLIIKLMFPTPYLFNPIQDILNVLINDIFEQLLFAALQ